MTNSSLEITGKATNTNQPNESTQRRTGHESGNRRDSRRDDRRDRSDAQYKSLTDILRPQLGVKNLTPRAELIHKWLKLSLASQEILPEYNIKIGTISREQGYEVRYPGLIITVNLKNTNRVASHVLLVSDGETIEPKKRRVYAGEDITPIVVPSKIWGEFYEKQVKAEIAEMYKDIIKGDVADIKFASMGCTVIPHSMPIAAYGENPSNDHNPLDPLYIQVVESLTSFDRFIRRDTSLVQLGRSFNPKYQMMSANVDQIPAVEFDALGQPRRSDFCISLSVKKRNDRDSDDRRDREDEDYNKVDSEESGTILRVTGFVTPYYTEPDLEKRRPQNFGLNIVVTDISGDSTPSPELFLYGLACTSILTANDQWVDGFKPAILTGTPNRNPGGLFLEIPDSKGEAMHRKEYPTTAQAELLDDIDFLFSDEVKVSLDCNDSGPLAWITDMFVFNNSKDVFEASNNLTDNEYEDIARGDYDIIVRDETRRFYLGNAETEQGTRDIREVEYLYLINAFDENSSAEAAKEWDYSINTDNEYGLFQRLRAIEDVYGHGSFTITGFTDRVVIEPLFLRDLVDALEGIDMLPSYDNYSKNHRPKQRLSAEAVRGTLSARELGSAYRGKSHRGFGRGNSHYRDRD